jgi:hypothetical protein
MVPSLHSSEHIMSAQFVGPFALATQALAWQHSAGTQSASATHELDTEPVSSTFSFGSDEILESVFWLPQAATTTATTIAQIATIAFKGFMFISYIGLLND